MSRARPPAVVLVLSLAAALLTLVPALAADNTDSVRAIRARSLGAVSIELRGRVRVGRTEMW